MPGRAVHVKYRARPPTRQRLRRHAVTPDGMSHALRGYTEYSGQPPPGTTSRHGRPVVRGEPVCRRKEGQERGLLLVERRAGEANVVARPGLCSRHGSQLTRALIG